MPDPFIFVHFCYLFVLYIYSLFVFKLTTKDFVVPLRLDAIFQDSNIVLSLVQWQNIHQTAVCFDYPCMDGCFTNTGAL